MLKAVLSSEDEALADFASRSTLGKSPKEILRETCSQQRRVIQIHLRDIKRMEEQIDAVHASITTLLDLKHRYENVFEARFARYQATGTVHHGQTIMVFTIVTVAFLPLSFIGTLFTINNSDFPQGDSGEPSMTLAYVSKWMVGIGFAISVPLVALALSYESMKRVLIERCRVLLEKCRIGWRRPTQNSNVTLRGKQGGQKDTQKQRHGLQNFHHLGARLSKRENSHSLADV
ncbi:hypothetical protein BU23DRAFT_575914 [Bimuria novae-zelandiae CBS 107.79]|uniref:Cora-domain-containing protein n=1 Tax=Bimuria novae-zelandiae CBS 107.79 TaxID=1447943 RepID=A0A6A5UGY7_9PLEO|nr:hypothetical protein BU23DRAFT_575914 [Bimuria novae-zelandiae CBS 107.79]